MKKRFALLMIAVLTLSLLSACAASGTANNGQGGASGPVTDGGDLGQGTGTMITPGNTSDASADNLLTEQQAEQIALEHVQLTQEQVSGMRVRYDFDDGIPEYDVEFYYDGVEYEFEIHAQTGKILSFEKDR